MKAVEFRGEYRPSIHRMTLGNAEVCTILDGAHVRGGVNPPYAMDKTDEQIAAIAAAHHLPAHGFEQTYTCTVVSIGDQLVLFDTGFGAMGRDNHAGQLRRRLAVAGYAPGDVDVVAFTHCHPDHIAGVMEGGNPAYPNARYVVGRCEYDAWHSGNGIPDSRAQNREMFQKLIVPLADRFTFLEDGDNVVPGIRTEAAFGHSLGHMMYRVESAGKSLLIWGDVTNHYIYSLRYPDSPVAFDDDKEAAKATRNRVLDMVATDRLLVAGFHMPFPAVGYVDRIDNGYAWVPMTYQARI